jgi:hypothetical protein
MSIEAESLGVSSGLFGGRPTFAVVRELGDDPRVTLYELLPGDLADGRERRIQRSSQHQSLRKEELAEVLVGVKQNKKGIIRATEEDVGIYSEHTLSEWRWDNWYAVPVTTLRGQRQRAVSKILRVTLEDASISPSQVLTGEGTALLSEAPGVRLAIAFMGVKRLQRYDKMIELVNGIEQMGLEECYYWHAKCRSPDSPNGVTALRKILTGHIQ